MSSKLKYAQAMQDVCTTLAQAIEQLQPLVATYYKREYNVSEGPNELVDDDVVSLGIKSADVGAAVTLGEQLINFRDNLAVVQGDYYDTLAEMRMDQ